MTADMAGELGQRVLDVLAAEGPEMPIVVLARHLAVPPTRLVGVLDDLHDEGLVDNGRARGSVMLVPVRHEEGRFTRPAAPADRAHTRSR
jgi:DNA-binding IclR family transcriptional regulator